MTFNWLSDPRVLEIGIIFTEGILLSQNIGRNILDKRIMRDRERFSDSHRALIEERLKRDGERRLENETLVVLLTLWGIAGSILIFDIEPPRKVFSLQMLAAVALLFLHDGARFVLSRRRKNV